MRSMPRLRTYLCLIICALSLSAFGQFDGGKMPNLDYFPVLLLDSNVQKELHVSPAVADQVKNDVMQEGMKMIPYLGMGKATPEQQKKMMAAILKTYQEMQDKAVAHLNPAQKARLHQLTLQFYGPAALLQPKVSKQVGLSETQVDRLRAAIAVDRQESYKDLSKGGPSTNYMAQAEILKKKREAERGLDEHAVATILNRQQRERWAGLQGQKMQLSKDGLSSIIGGM